jgi:hypothetical protein
VLILAVAAMATAWSGFQASQWDDRGGLLYGQATTQRSLPLLPPPLAANSWPRTLAAASDASELTPEEADEWAASRGQDRPDLTEPAPPIRRIPLVSRPSCVPVRVRAACVLG